MKFASLFSTSVSVRNICLMPINTRTLLYLTTFYLDWVEPSVVYHFVVSRGPSVLVQRIAVNI